MNLDAIFDDLESEFERLNQTKPGLTEFTVAGYRKVVFARDHFVGCRLLDNTVCLVTYSDTLDLEPGRSEKSDRKFTKSIKSLVGLWIEVRTSAGQFAGRLRAIECGLMVFHARAIPIASVMEVSLRAVDNPQRS